MVINAPSKPEYEELVDPALTLVVQMRFIRLCIVISGLSGNQCQMKKALLAKFQRLS